MVKIYTHVYDEILSPHNHIVWEFPYIKMRKYLGYSKWKNTTDIHTELFTEKKLEIIKAHL